MRNGRSVIQNRRLERRGQHAARQAQRRQRRDTGWRTGNRDPVVRMGRQILRGHEDIDGVVTDDQGDCLRSRTGGDGDTIDRDRGVGIVSCRSHRDGVSLVRDTRGVIQLTDLEIRFQRTARQGQAGESGIVRGLACQGNDVGRGRGTILRGDIHLDGVFPDSQRQCLRGRAGCNWQPVDSKRRIGIIQCRGDRD